MQPLGVVCAFEKPGVPTDLTEKTGKLLTAIDLKSFAPKRIVARHLVSPLAPGRPKTIATVAGLML